MAQDWLYFLLYVGEQERSDLCLAQVVTPLVRSALTTPGIDRWFFLRYLDDAGPHLRLRFHGDVDAINDLFLRAGPVLAHRLQTLPELEVEPATPLVGSARAMQRPDAAGSRPPALQLGVYEPEYAKYGGPEGVALAERVFQASSEIALDNLHHLGDRTTRALWAMAMMQTVLEACLVHQDGPTFWEQYAWHWSGAARPGAGALREHLTKQAAPRGQAVRQRIDRLLTEPTTRRQLARHAEVVRNALDEAEHLNLPPARKQPRLSSHPPDEQPNRPRTHRRDLPGNPASRRISIGGKLMARLYMTGVIALVIALFALIGVLIRDWIALYLGAAVVLMLATSFLFLSSRPR